MAGTVLDGAPRQPEGVEQVVQVGEQIGDLGIYWLLVLSAGQLNMPLQCPVGDAGAEPCCRWRCRRWSRWG